MNNTTISPLGDDDNDGRHNSGGEASHQLGENENDGTELTVPSVEGHPVDENEASSAAKVNKTTRNVTPEKRDIFDDLAALGRPLDEIIASQKVMTTLEVRKPKGDEWVRVHPVILTRVYAYENSDRSWHLVLPNVVEPLGSVVRYVQMSLAVTYLAEPFVWPVPIPAERKPYRSHVSAFAAAERAQKEWIRISWDRNDYRVYRRTSAEAEPVWPPEIANASEMLRLAVKGGGLDIIDSLDHPVARTLLGND